MAPKAAVCRALGEEVVVQLWDRAVALLPAGGLQHTVAALLEHTVRVAPIPIASVTVVAALSRVQQPVAADALAASAPDGAIAPHARRAGAGVGPTLDVHAAGQVVAAPASHQQAGGGAPASGAV